MKYLAARIDIRNIIIVLSFTAISACSSLKKITVERDLNQIVNKSEVFSNEWVGISIFDPYEEKYLMKKNDDKYFTPASNTKLLTLYAYLSLGLDDIPTFAYAYRGDSLILRPLGDPTFLHPDFRQQEAQKWLEDKEAGTVFIDYPDIALKKYGPGWAWDDYDDSFQPERSPFPLYGNALTVIQFDTLVRVIPEFFRDYVDFETLSSENRHLEENIFFFNKPVGSGRDTIQKVIPFRTSRELTSTLLNDAFGFFVRQRSENYELSDTVFNGRSLALYAVMMLRSDNFLAEQMLYMGAVQTRSESIEQYISRLENNELNFLPDPLIWVDGSGLSRYNMTTPRNQVALLHRLYKQMSWEEIETVFPTGGESGTISKWYADAFEPYVFAKTGTLRHNHCLSGYLKTRSGKTIIFSIMNNHFTRPVNEIKAAMQSLLEDIRDSY